MELWQVFGSRTEYLNAPKAVAQRCLHILTGKHLAEKDEHDKANGDIHALEHTAQQQQHDR